MWAGVELFEVSCEQNEKHISQGTARFGLRPKTGLRPRRLYQYKHGNSRLWRPLRDVFFVSLARVQSPHGQRVYDELF